MYHFRLLATLVEFGPASRRLSAGTPASTAVTWLPPSTSWPPTATSTAPRPADGRRNIITLTASGRRQHKRLAALVEQAQDEIFALPRLPPSGPA